MSEAQLMGTAQNGVLKEYVARGTYIFPPRSSLRLAADLMVYCSSNMPKFNSISVSDYHIRDAGATAAQEMGFTFANAIAYIEDVQQALIQRIPMGRFGKAEEVASLVRFLVTEGDYITGQQFNVNGGMYM